MTDLPRPDDPGGKAVLLKPGKDKAVRNRHHWIFSGAVRRFPDFELLETMRWTAQAGIARLERHLERSR